VEDEPGLTIQGGSQFTGVVYHKKLSSEKVVYFCKLNIFQGVLICLVARLNNIFWCLQQKLL
jgi:hypothetical protein